MQDLNNKLALNEENENKLQLKLKESNSLIKNIKNENQTLNQEISSLRNMLNWFCTKDIE